MFFEDIKLNTEIDIEPVIIEKEKMLSFARDYDSRPIHTDEDYAKASPFGALLAPGVMTFMSVWNKYIEQDLFGSEFVAGKSTKIEWHKPVFADDTLFGKAIVTAKTEKSPKNGIVEITFFVRNQQGETVLTDVTEIFVKRKSI